MNLIFAGGGSAITPPSPTSTTFRRYPKGSIMLLDRKMTGIFDECINHK